MTSNFLFVIGMVVFKVFEIIPEASGCSVTPPAAAVVANDSVSLSCSAQGDEAIDSWSLQNVVVYRPNTLYGNGQIRLNKTIAKGYFVNDSDPKTTILIINSTTLDHAGEYKCTCTSTVKTEASTYLSVLESEPQFPKTISVIDGDSQNLTCSVYYNGTAYSSLVIRNSLGTVLSNKTNTGSLSNTIEAKSVASIDLSNTSVFHLTYFCNVTLWSSETNTIVYMKILHASVLYPVQNVHIMPDDPSRCVNGSECAVGQILKCAAEGNPYPEYFQWMISVNGSEPYYIKNNNNNSLTLTDVGQFSILCTASNKIKNVFYNSTSDYFTSNVTVSGPSSFPVQGDSTYERNLIIGLVIGIGGSITIILIIILIYICKKKHRTVCCNEEELRKAETSNNCESKEFSSYKMTNGLANNGYVKSTETLKPMAPGNHPQTSPGGDETILVENDLYSKSNVTKQPGHIDPSDGGYASVGEIL